MTYKSHIKAPNRAFDHLYDPLFCTADVRNVQQENMSALIRTAPVAIYPIYENMFTDLPQLPRNTYSLLQNPLPTQQIPTSAVRSHRRRPITVSGSERVKYFHNPKCDTKTIIVALDAAASVSNSAVALSLPNTQRNGRKREQTQRTVACQTLYREQSAQTRPYLVPAAATQHHGVGTPKIISAFETMDVDTMPGIYEAVVIERARKRRQCEAMLKTHAANTKEWLSGRFMLEAIEWSDWLGREKDLEYCQQLRLNIVRQLLDQRHQNMRLNSAVKIDDCQQKFAEERDRRIGVLYKNYNRNLRQLNRNVCRSKHSKKAETITDGYLNYASDVYGPLARLGSHPRNTHFLKHGSRYEARLERLHKLEPQFMSSMRHRKLQPRIDEPKPAIREFSKGFWDVDNLQKVYHTLKTLRLKSNVHREIGNCVRRIKHNNNVTSDGSQSSTSRSREFLHSQQSLLASLLKKECDTHSLLEQTDTSTATSMLELLDRQINELTSQRKAHAMHLLAAREHTQRELETAASSGSLNEWRQRQEEDIYRRIMQAHNDTSTYYLENVLVECFKNIADREARDRIHSMAKRYDQNITDHMATIDEDAPDTSADVSDVMENYVLPAVFRRLDGHIERKQLMVDLHNLPMDAYDDQHEDTDMEQQHRTYNMRGEVFESHGGRLHAAHTVVSPVSDDMLHDILEEVIADHDDEHRRDALNDIISNIFDRIAHMMDDDDDNYGHDDQGGDTTSER